MSAKERRSRKSYSPEFKLQLVKKHCSSSGSVLARWINEVNPDRRRIFISTINQNAPFEPELKRQAVKELCTRHVPASEIARNICVSRTVLYKWKDEIIGNKAYQAMRKHNAPSLEEERDALPEEIARLNQEIRRQQSGPAPDNLLARDFKAARPNQKWLTYITEFQLPTGKVWLSPVHLPGLRHTEEAARRTLYPFAAS